jgi:hypothetical protein
MSEQHQARTIATMTEAQLAEELVQKQIALTGATILIFIAANLVVCFVAWKFSQTSLSFYRFAMYVVDVRMKYLSADETDQFWFDQADIVRARILCGLVTACVGVGALLLRQAA